MNRVESDRNQSESKSPNEDEVTEQKPMFGKRLGHIYRKAQKKTEEAIVPLKYSLSFAKLSTLLQENAMVEHAPCPSADPDSYVDYIEQFTVPTGPQVAAAAGLARAWFKPRFVGLENLPDGPALFIGNHAFMAIDAELFHLYLYYDYGRYVKGLGDKTLFANAHYAAIAHAMGGVSGQAQIVERLMDRGKD